MNNNAILAVVCGPSGVGKGTVVERARELAKDRGIKLGLSVSMTTRDIRPGEIDGVTYRYVTTERFMKALNDSELLEHNLYGGNYYGTPASEVERALDNGNSIILEIDVNGADQIIRRFSDRVVSVFILPPSVQELERRLRDRGRDSEEDITKRLMEGEREIARADDFNYQIINNTVDEAAEQLLDIIEDECERMPYMTMPQSAVHKSEYAAPEHKSVKSGMIAGSTVKKGEKSMNLTIDEIYGMCSSRYALVNIVAKKARELAHDAHEADEKRKRLEKASERTTEKLTDKANDRDGEKPVNAVLANLRTGKYTIVKAGAAAMYEEDDYAIPEVEDVYGGEEN